MIECQDTVNIERFMKLKTFQTAFYHFKVFCTG